MRVGNILAALRIAASLLLVILAVLLGNAFQRLMDLNYRAEYFFEVAVGSQMSALGAFCLVLILSLAASWVTVSGVVSEFAEGASADVKKLRIVIFAIIVVLLIGLAIVGNYYAQRISRWYF